MATQDGEKSTGNRIFFMVVNSSLRAMASVTSLPMCSGFVFTLRVPKSPSVLGPRLTMESRRSRERLNHDLVHVAPSPVLARFKGPHNRVLGLAEMLCGVPVLRGIAAADMAADFAKAQMDPRSRPSSNTPRNHRLWGMGFLSGPGVNKFPASRPSSMWMRPGLSAEQPANKPGIACRPDARRLGSRHGDS